MLRFITSYKYNIFFLLENEVKTPEMCIIVIHTTMIIKVDTRQ